MNLMEVKPEIIGYKFLPGDRVEKDEWESIMKNKTTQNKIWHALKW
jgi:hypothetical protein